MMQLGRRPANPCDLRPVQRAAGSEERDQRRRNDHDDPEHDPLKSAVIERAIETVLAGGGPKTPDLAGKANTKEVGEAIAAEISR